MYTNKKAFTLVELIVVITILAILGTIAFLSMEDYSKSSRNSVRITDIGILKQTLGIFEVENGKYPLPKNYEEITYKGGLLWHQGTFDDQVRLILDNLSKKPVDPLFEIEYDYSVINNKTKYQIGTIIEGGLFANNSVLNTSYALNYGEITSYVTGNYDLFDVKSQSGSNCYLLSIPSLFVNNQSSTGALSSLTNHNFIFDTSNNITLNYGTRITSSQTPVPFITQESLSSCSVNTMDELNLYISKLSVIYQQLIDTGDFKEIIYDFAQPTFKIGMIDNLISNGIFVNSDLAGRVLNPSEGNIFNDTFTDNSSINLIGDHTPDTFGSWSNNGALINSSYTIDGNTLMKNDSNDGVIFPNPVLPINSRDRILLFNVTDFSGGEIVVYSSYYDDNNYYGVAINSNGYEIRNYVAGVQNVPYPLILSESIPNNSLIEFIISGNNFKLLINGIEKENNIDISADFNGIPGLKIGTIGGKIDNFNLIYK